MLLLLLLLLMYGGMLLLDHPLLILANKDYTSLIVTQPCKNLIELHGFTRATGVVDTDHVI